MTFSHHHQLPAFFQTYFRIILYSRIWINPKIFRASALEATSYDLKLILYNVETTYLWNKFIFAKLMTFVENAETGQFLFLIILILSCFTCSWRHQFLSYDVITNSLFSFLSDKPSYYPNSEWKKMYLIWKKIWENDKFYFKNFI
jgi:hypothetical protein